jgi:hypothetical protein
VGNRINELAIRTILVTFLSAIDTISRLPTERDVRVLLAEGARDRALQFLAQAERRVPYDPGSYLDSLIRESRTRIEQAQVQGD